MAFVEVFDFLVNTLIVLIIGVLLYFAFSKAYHLYTAPDSEHFIHDIVFMFVLLKIYRLLVSFLRFNHVSVKYIVEISIIAPAIEIIFAYQMHDIITLALLGVFCIANLLIYLLYFSKLKEIDQIT